MGFQKDFLWGAASAAFQIEGAWDEDGKRPSVWDTASHTRGRIAHGEVGDTACDHYHRMREDVALLKELGLKSYRFSVSWPRVILDETGAVNEKGMRFYSDLKEVSARLGKGIIAFSPLAQGLLTDRYLKGIPADSRIMTDGRFLKEGVLTPERLDQIRRLNDLAAQRGQTLAQMALSWVLRDGVVTSVLAGASKPQQVLDNIKAAENTRFTAEELALIDQISP